MLSIVTQAVALDVNRINPDVNQHKTYEETSSPTPRFICRIFRLGTPGYTPAGMKKRGYERDAPDAPDAKRGKGVAGRSVPVNDRSKPVDWPPDVPWPPVAIPWNNSSGYRGVDSAGGGFSVKVNEKPLREGRLPYGNDTLEERRKSGQIWADRMTDDNSTAQMNASYIAAFRTAVKFTRLTEKGREVKGWWKGLVKTMRSLPPSNAQMPCMLGLLILEVLDVSHVISFDLLRVIIVH